MSQILQRVSAIFPTLSPQEQEQILQAIHADDMEQRFQGILAGPSTQPGIQNTRRIDQPTQAPVGDDDPLFSLEKRRIGDQYGNFQDVYNPPAGALAREVGTPTPLLPGGLNPRVGPQGNPFHQIPQAGRTTPNGASGMSYMPTPAVPDSVDELLGIKIDPVLVDPVQSGLEAPQMPDTGLARILQGIFGAGAVLTGGSNLPFLGNAFLGGSEGARQQIATETAQYEQELDAYQTALGDLIDTNAKIDIANARQEIEAQEATVSAQQDAYDAKTKRIDADTRSRKQDAADAVDKKRAEAEARIYAQNPGLYEDSIAAEIRKPILANQVLEARKLSYERSNRDKTLSDNDKGRIRVLMSEASKARTRIKDTVQSLGRLAVDYSENLASLSDADLRAELAKRSSVTPPTLTSQLAADALKSFEEVDAINAELMRMRGADSRFNVSPRQEGNPDGNPEWDAILGNGGDDAELDSALTRIESFLGN